MKDGLCTRFCSSFDNPCPGASPDIPEGQLEIEKLVREHYEAPSLPVPGRMLRMMRRFIRKDLQPTQMGWRPIYLEKRFEGWRLSLCWDGTAAGSDRPDRRWPKRELCPLRLQTGTGPTLKDVRLGKEVQIATYLLAAQKLIPQAENVGVAYYLTQNAKRIGIFRDDYTRQLLLRKGDNCLEPEAFARQLEFFKDAIRFTGTDFCGEFPPNQHPVASALIAHIKESAVGRWGQGEF